MRLSFRAQTVRRVSGEPLRALRTDLHRIASLNEDRALSALYNLIDATLRTSFFAPSEGGHLLAFKIDPARLPELRPPHPYREIFVYSRAFRGIHIRGGPISRGGLRWSDRADDLREA